MGISAAGAANPNRGPEQNTGNIDAFNSLMQALETATETFDIEAMGADKKAVDPNSGDGNNTAVMQQDTPEVAQSQYIQSDQLTEEAQKKKKLLDKKSKFEEKLEMLGKLEELIDETQVEEKEKGAIREFFDNMGRIKNLRGRLKQLSQEEEMLEERLRQHEEQQQRQQQQQEEENEQNEETP